MIRRNVLAVLPLFRDAAPGMIDALASRANEVTYKPGRTIFRKGDTARGWYIVIEGDVRVVRGSGSKQHVIHTEGPGGTLGEVPVFAGVPHPATAIAVQTTRCALLDRRELEAAISEAPRIAFLINRRLALRVQSLVSRLDDRASLNVRERLMSFLVLSARGGDSNIATIGMSQRALAEELGTVREVVSRAIRSLVRSGCIEARGRRRYRILDRGNAALRDQ